MTTQYMIDPRTKRHPGGLREVAYSVAGFATLILLLSLGKHLLGL